jgi:hypothetical protein
MASIGSGAGDLDVRPLVGVHQRREYLELVPLGRARLSLVPQALDLLESSLVVGGGADRLDVHDLS